IPGPALCVDRKRGERSFVTNTTYLASVPTSGADEPVKRAASLSTMKLAELQGLAGSLGLTGTAKMRKGDLVTAIRGRQSGASSKAGSTSADTTQTGSSSADTTSAPAEAALAAPPTSADESAPAATEQPGRTSRRAQRPVGVTPADEIAAPAATDQAAPVAVDQAAPVATAPQNLSLIHISEPTRQAEI